ncbi:uncharacterized protein [Dysidea avara]|uniref:uncharacterized protein isoform X2 n=1 Tax=Dysidea avara TaxID=196820 RepID=UPI0033205A8A
MAGPLVNVWVKYENALKPSRVKVPPGGCVIDVIEEVQTHYPELKSGYATAFFEGNELDMDFKISDIIMSVTCRNPILIKSLLLSVPTQDPIVYKHPSLEGQAPSTINKHQHRKAHDVSIYCHWFALELYKLFEYLENTPTVFASEDENICVAVDNSTYSIPKSSLEEAAGSIEEYVCVADDNKQPGNRTLRSPFTRSEISLTAWVSRILDRFLFSIAKQGFCAHQGPVGSKPDENKMYPADLYVAKVITKHSGALLPDEVVLVADAKLYNFKEAKNQSIGYTISSMEHSVDQNLFNVQLALPYTEAFSRLDVHVEIHDGIWVIPITKHNKPLWNKALLCTVYAGVHYLLDHPLHSDGPLTMSKPFKQWEDGSYSVHGARDYESRYANSGRVFHYNSKVYKFFDGKNDYLKPNQDLLNRIGENGKPYLPELVVKGVSYDEKFSKPRFQMMSYNYLEGNHHPKSVHQFIPILCTLQKIHDLGMVHGDIRSCNLVFGENNSWIIDFDMASPEETPYCGYYNREGIYERHNGATKGGAMYKFHDRYSLAMLMQKCDDHSSYLQVIKSVKNGQTPLDELAQKLKDNTN